MCKLKELDPREQQPTIDADYVLEQAIIIYEKIMAADTFNAIAAIRALELIGRHIQIQAFQENRRHNHSIDKDTLLILKDIYDPTSGHRDGLPSQQPKLAKVK